MELEKKIDRLTAPGEVFERITPIVSVAWRVPTAASWWMGGMAYAASGLTKVGC